MSIQEFKDFLKDKHQLPSSVIEAVEENGVGGEVFMQLSEIQLKEIAPRLADRITLQGIQKSEEARKAKETMPMVSSLILIGTTLHVLILPPLLFA